ncbi:hypothetical protein Ddye_022242 [Dipteronia dyeriana]|uniref:Uncharacterized protein n=1 Tax=Dipteronia dyeriana TaxID=168575 RepID=A0AAD9U3A9_9ROSI|nr:hypothetical protein Ddye_022242 [Dipteronia dyeriana]
MSINHNHKHKGLKGVEVALFRPVSGLDRAREGLAVAEPDFVAHLCDLIKLAEYGELPVLKTSSKPVIASQTEITLRPYQLSDVDDFMEWENDDKVIRSSRIWHYTTNEDVISRMSPYPIPGTEPSAWTALQSVSYQSSQALIIRDAEERGLMRYALWGSKY